MANNNNNIFQTRRVNNQQTINSNRFSIRFKNLHTFLKRASSSTILPNLQNRYNAVLGALGGDMAESLELSLVSSTFPVIGIEIVNIPRFNDWVKATTKFSEMEAFDVVFMDYVNGSASAIMQLWHAFVGDKETGAMGFKQDFVLPTAEFLVYGPDAPGYEVSSSADIPYLQKYELVNIFPQSVNLGEHSAESAEPRKVTISFQIDNVYPVRINGYNYSANVTKPEERYTSSPTNV